MLDLVGSPGPPLLADQTDKRTAGSPERGTGFTSRVGEQAQMSRAPRGVGAALAVTGWRVAFYP
jgi:hypothetical protein